MDRDAGQLGYTPISVDELPLGEPLPFAIYTRSNAQHRRFILYRPARSAFDKEAQAYLTAHGIHEVFVQARDLMMFKNKKGGRSEQPRSKEERLKKEALQAYSLAADLMRELLREPLREENLKQAVMVVDQVVENILEHDSILKHLVSLTAHDYYTYTHSVNVCIYSLGLAHRLGYQDPERLKSVGIGSLLHDIGKSHIDPNILRKPGPLNDREWKTMQSHPLLGAQILAQRTDIPPTAIVVPLQHHERFEGSGYPRGLVGEKIHLFGRIACIADVYDALTTNRTYRRALPPRKALRLMAEEMTGNFDRDLLVQFVAFLNEAKESGGE